jgi:hypothetical protein
VSHRRDTCAPPPSSSRGSLRRLSCASGRCRGFMAAASCIREHMALIRVWERAVLLSASPRFDLPLFVVAPRAAALWARELRPDLKGQAVSTANACLASLDCRCGWTTPAPDPNYQRTALAQDPSSRRRVGAAAACGLAERGERSGGAPAAANRAQRLACGGQTAWKGNRVQMRSMTRRRRGGRTEPAREVGARVSMLVNRGDRAYLRDARSASTARAADLPGRGLPSS